MSQHPPDNDPAPPVHVHSYTAKKTPATCQTEGYTTYTCACGDSYTADYVTGSHNYVKNRCTYCGKENTDGMYAFFKNWILTNGQVDGDCMAFSDSAGNYGGYNDENLNLFYWSDNEKVDITLHSILSETYSIRFTLYIPQTFNGQYEFESSYYYRDTGYSVCSCYGTLNAGEFTDNFPLPVPAGNYYGPDSLRRDFLEASRTGMCDLLKCFGQFLQKKDFGYTMTDLGFTHFA